MKKLICIVLLFPTLNLFGQDELYKRELPLNDENRIEFVEVVEIPGKTQDELYISAKTWIAENYNSANDVIQMDDKEAGKLIVKGIYSYSMSGINYKLHHTLKIYQKEGKARVSLGGLNLKYRFMDVDVEMTMKELVVDKLYKRNGKPNKGSKEQKENLISSWENTKQSIIEGLKSKGTNEDDW